MRRPCPSQSVCVSHKSRSIKTTERIQLVLAWELPSTYPTLAYKKIWVSPKKGYFTLELCPKLWTKKILPRQVGHVVNKTRQWSSLWMTPTIIDVTLLNAYTGCPNKYGPPTVFHHY